MRVTVVANCSQAFVNVLFGVASVVSSLGLKSFNPIVFGLIRALLTAVLLVVLKWDERLMCCGRLTVRKQDVGRFVAAGICLYIGEFFYIMGVEFSGSIRASLWQPSQPIWTMAITAALGHERMGFKKFLGLLAAFFGCAAMVLGRAETTQDERGLMRDLMGNMFLFLNCTVGTPLYIISVKPLLTEYPAFAVTGLTFAVNTLCFGVTVACAPFFMDYAKLVPPAVFWDWAAVVYVAVFATVLPYVIQMWCTKILPASLVSAYYVLQPVAAAVLVYILRSFGVDLEGGQWADLGAVAVLAGLWVVVRETEVPDVPEKDDEVTSLVVDENGAFSPVANGIRDLANSPLSVDASATLHVGLRRGGGL